MSEPSQKMSKEEIEMTKKMYDIFDEVVEASQDPNNHPGFEQLRKYHSENSAREASVLIEKTPRIRTPEEAEKMRENLKQTEAINALEGISPSPELRELTERVIRGEVTHQEGFEQMKKDLFKKFNITSQTE